MERAGIDIISDGEIRRESYSNRFATALGGMDLDNPGVALDRTGHPNPVPRVVGPIRRLYPVEVRDVEFLRRNTDRRIKITVPGPFTVTQQAQNDYYSDDKALALDIAAAINEEIKSVGGGALCQFCRHWPCPQINPKKRSKNAASLSSPLASVRPNSAA